MATKIYNDPWSPSNINCNWKPEKLSRYSFVKNKIDFNAADVELGHSQTGSYPVENSETNLTDYIEVNQSTYYSFKAEEGVLRGVRYAAYFNSNKAFLSYGDFPSQVTLAINFKTPVDCAYVKLTIYKEAWEKCTLMLSSGYSFSDKGTTPLDIVDNKVGAQIYKDLHFEVYIKAEALIKNFVDYFSLRAFQRFPNSESYWYESTNSILFQTYTYPWYRTNYSFSDFVANHQYQAGDRVKGSYIGYFNIDYYLVCRVAHTSADTFNNEIKNNLNYWISVGNRDNYWLQVDKNVKESNYNSEIGFPYVGSLLFKNLWGCDMTNYLSTFVNESNLTLYYYNFFAENLRKVSTYYDKFFNEGYFEAASHYNSTDYEGFGVRLIRGESFRNDELLGDFVANNYLEYSESNHNIPENWDYSTDDIVKIYFGGSVHNPFDHYYRFVPKIGMPFFKEKEFSDFKIELVLQRKDILGNIFQRIVDLPILVNFYNNLIKGYWGPYDSNKLQLLRFYTSEFLNSNFENLYTAVANGHDIVTCTFIWCPNVNRLSLSSTIIGPQAIVSAPRIIKLHDGGGQVCIISYTFSGTTTPGIKMKAVHNLEYSDGENYDKFTYIETITMVAP